MKVSWLCLRRGPSYLFFFPIIFFVNMAALRHLLALTAIQTQICLAYSVTRHVL